MNLADYSKLEGTHALFSASKGSWVNDTSEEQILKRYINSFATVIGTSVHKFAKNCIDEKMKLSKTDKKILLYHLLTDPEANIPKEVIDLDYLFPNVRNYVNDAIDFDMRAEQLLVYSDLSYGTADSISHQDNFLRIHDLKTGRSPVHIEQLLIYAAYFCLDHEVKPQDFNGIELRIYQNSEIIYYEPKVEEIQSIMAKSVFCNQVVNNFRKSGALV